MFKDMKNNLENLELKLAQTKIENHDLLDKIENQFKQDFGDFFAGLFKNDNLGFKRYINVAFQLKKLDNDGETDFFILKESIEEAIKLLAIDNNKKEIFEKKLVNLLNNNIDFNDRFRDDNNLIRNQNFPILEDLERYGVLDKNDMIQISLKYKETNNFFDSIGVLNNYKKDIIKYHIYELNNTKQDKRLENFNIDFKDEIADSKLLIKYPKVLKFIGKNYIRLNLKNKVESKKDKLKRLYKIAFLKFYKLKYSGIDIDSILDKIDNLSDFDEFVSLIIKYFEVLKQNPSLQKDYIVSNEIEDIQSLQLESEENKQKILLIEKNTIKVNEVFEKHDKQIGENDLEELLGDGFDLVGKEFINRKQITPLSAGILNEKDINNNELEDEEDDDFNNGVNLEEYYENIKLQYSELEKKKQKLFLEGNYDELDDLNDEILKILQKIKKIEVLLGIDEDE